jgi:hypothetical protein
MLGLRAMKWLLPVAVTISLAGCGGSKHKLESATTCSATWQALIGPKPWDITSSLVYNDGKLYYGSYTGNAIVAQPIDGSPSRVFAAVPTLELWLEGDHLLFSQGNDAVQIGSVPLSGGTPQIALDGAAGRTSTGLATAHVFTPTDFYWSEIPFPAAQSPTTIWHQSRLEGLPEALGTITFQKQLSATAIALSNNSVLAATLSGEAYTLPITGGAPSPLALPAQPGVMVDLAGLDPQGAYTTLFFSAQAGPLMLSPADGSPAKPFWPTLPSDAQVEKIWPNPEGGWVVVATQAFDDGLFHTTLTLLDEQGIAIRLGCSPADAERASITVPVAIAPDAVYAATQDPMASTWAIDRIAR